MTTLPTTAPARRPLRIAAVLCALALVPATAAFGAGAAVADPPKPGAAVADAPEPGAAVADPPKPEALVTIGDSFISGEGARWMGNAEGLRNFGGIPQALRDKTDRVTSESTALSKIYTPGCHRSDAAAIGEGAPKRYNLACAGAQSADLVRPFKKEGAQLDRLTQLATENDVRVIVVSVGAQDARLVETMRACAVAWKENHYCSTDTAVTGPAAERMRTVGDKVATAVEAVKEAVRDTGSAPRIVVQSYPMPLASGEAATTSAHDENSWDRWSAYGCPFYNKDLRWLSAGSTALNTEIKKAARKAGVDFVDLGRMLDGHQVCGRAPLRTTFAADGTTVVMPAAARAEWARYIPRTSAELPADEAQELLHPNYYGQQALGRCLSLVVSRLATTPAGSAAQCVGGAGLAPNQVTVAYAP